MYVAENRRDAYLLRNLLENNGILLEKNGIRAIMANFPRKDELADRRDAAAPQETSPASWPRCPQCGAPRITKCPACGTSGTGFPRADETGEEPPDEAAARPLLLCIECDEPFTPEYAHDCEWCGHEFPDGFRSASDYESEGLSPGLLAIVGITLAIVVGLFVYFAILLD